MPRRSKVNKAPKDSNAPKRPLSSYMVFNKQRMQALRAEQPDKKITELSKMVGAEWRGLTAEQKHPFTSEAAQLKEKFNADMAEYRQSEHFAEFEGRLKAWKISEKEKKEEGDDERKKNEDEEDDDRPALRPKAQKRPKDPNAPKKPMTGFFVFQSRRRRELKEDHPEKKHTELVKMASEEWKGMTGEQKEPFEAQSRLKKAEYAEAMAVYKESEEFRKYQGVLANWKAGKVSAAKKAVKAKSAAPVVPVAARAKSSSESESYSDDSSESGSPQRRSSRKSDSESEESDVEMDENGKNEDGSEIREWKAGKVSAAKKSVKAKSAAPVVPVAARAPAKSSSESESYSDDSSESGSPQRCGGDERKRSDDSGESDVEMDENGKNEDGSEIRIGE